MCNVCCTLRWPLGPWPPPRMGLSRAQWSHGPSQYIRPRRGVMLIPHPSLQKENKLWVRPISNLVPTRLIPLGRKNLGMKLANQSSGCATWTFPHDYERFTLIDVAGGGSENLFQSRRQTLSLCTAETKTKLVLEVTSSGPVSKSTFWRFLDMVHVSRRSFICCRMNASGTAAPPTSPPPSSSPLPRSVSAPLSHNLKSSDQTAVRPSTREKPQPV